MAYERARFQHDTPKRRDDGEILKLGIEGTRQAQESADPFNTGSAFVSDERTATSLLREHRFTATTIGCSN